MTPPRTASQWADALDAVTGSGGDIDFETRHPASDVISRAFADGSAAGVTVASGEIHTMHGLADNQLLSADGRWLATYDEQAGHWTGDGYDRPDVRVSVDAAYDLMVAGLPHDEDTAADYAARWAGNARIIAQRLLVDLTVLNGDHCGHELPPGASRPFDKSGEPTVAHHIWQGAHDATPAQVGA